uniref:Guanylate cyclase domain-containing protein n=1 Tax=Amphora coffeiformis TaxID=265554 RepID=A0A7S3L710_9STRA
MGDGILAVFPEPDRPPRRESVRKARNKKPEYVGEGSLTFGDSSGICQNARCAAVQFQQQLQDWSAEHIKNGDPGVEVGIGLHYGNCSYGNVGAPSRLDFTVIGPSVNLASRVEGLCSKLGASILASEPFVSRDTAFNEEKWKPRGAFDLKGINGEVDVYEHIASVNRAESAEHK